MISASLRSFTAQILMRSQFFELTPRMILSQHDAEFFVIKPWYADIGFMEVGSNEHRIVCPFLEFNRYFGFGDVYVGSGINKISKDMA
jgi:hypothetical protein